VKGEESAKYYRNMTNVILTNTYMGVGGTIPWIESVESSWERRPRSKHNSRDGGGRNASGTAFGELKSMTERPIRPASN